MSITTSQFLKNFGGYKPNPNLQPAPTHKPNPDSNSGKTGAKDIQGKQHINLEKTPDKPDMPSAHKSFGA